MNTQHTPGPWRWYRARTLLHLHDAEGRSFAQVSAHLPRHEVPPTFCADCALISAAPELLEALEKIVRYADSEPDGGDCVEMHRANVERARAAIAKATT